MWSEITRNMGQLSERARQRVQGWTADEWKVMRSKRDGLLSNIRQRYGAQKPTADRQPSTIERDQG